MDLDMMPNNLGDLIIKMNHYIFISLHNYFEI